MKSKDAEFLINKYDQFIFLSPHLDDAVLSCAFLLRELKREKKRISVVSIFTKVSGRPYSKASDLFLRKCKYKNGNILFEDRRREDKHIMKSINCEYFHLNFIDAAWRKTGLFGMSSWFQKFLIQIPALIHIYPSENKLFSGRISFFDKHLFTSVIKKVGKIISKTNNALIVAPLGVGGHVDHVIVREAAQKFNRPILYWEDFPYNTDTQSVVNFHSDNPDYNLLFSLIGNARYKQKVIRLYKSQINALFPNDLIPDTSEKYFTFSFR